MLDRRVSREEPLSAAHRTRAAALLLVFSIVVGVLIACLVAVALVLLALALRRALG